MLLIGAVAAIVAATGTLRGVASAAAFTILIYYGIANLAALRMPRQSKLYPYFVASIGFATCALLAVSLSPGIILTGCTVLAAGIMLRLLFRRGLR